MIGLAKFAATAYPVSGLSDDLFEVRSCECHVMTCLHIVQCYKQHTCTLPGFWL